MTSKSATMGFKIAEIQQHIINLEYQKALLTPKDRQKLQQRKRTLQNLYQNSPIDSENQVKKSV